MRTLENAIAEKMNKDSEWENFPNCLPVSDDFGNAIFEAKREDI